MPMRLLSLTILSAGCPASKASPRVPLLHLLTTNITIIGRISIPTRTAFSSAGGQPLSRRREGVDAAAVISSRQQRYDGEGRQGNQPSLHLASIRRAEQYSPTDCNNQSIMAHDDVCAANSSIPTVQFNF